MTRAAMDALGDRIAEMKAALRRGAIEDARQLMRSIDELFADASLEHREATRPATVETLPVFLRPQAE